MQSDSTATSSVYAGRVYLIWINLSVLGYRILLKADEFYKAHNILLRSMNRRPSAEMNWGEYFLGVYPLSLQFSRDYNTKFQLYFEKSNYQLIKVFRSSLDMKRQQVSSRNKSQSSSIILLRFSTLRFSRIKTWIFDGVSISSVKIS